MPSGSDEAFAYLGKLLTLIEKNDKNYTKRNNLVFEALGVATHLGYSTGIGFDVAEGPGWLVVFIELPNGQVSWHVTAHTKPYDGHSTEEKYRRCREFTNPGTPCHLGAARKDTDHGAIDSGAA